MANITKSKTQITIAHPMEDVLGITPNTTEIQLEKRSTELVECEQYDEKDKELEDQFQEVYDIALDAFEIHSQDTETLEGRYKARNAEVAANFLNTALAAAREKAALKQHKDKLVRSGGNGVGPHTVNNNIIIDRNELLRTILGSPQTEKDITPDE